MARVPLRLESYYIDKLTFAVNPQYWQDNDENDESCRFAAENHVEVDTEILQHGIEKTLFQITMSVKLTDTAAAKTPYHISLAMNGIFRIEDGTDEETLDRFLTNAGATILYGAAREFVMQLTARGPAGPIILPAVSFPPLRRADSADADAKDPAPLAAAAPDPADSPSTSEGPKGQGAVPKPPRKKKPAGKSKSGRGRSGSA